MAQAHQPPDQQSNMRSKDPPVPVRLIYHDKLQMGKERAPLRMPRQHLVEFMGVGDDDP